MLGYFSFLEKPYFIAAGCLAKLPLIIGLVSIPFFSNFFNIFFLMFFLVSKILTESPNHDGETNLFSL